MVRSLICSRLPRASSALVVEQHPGVVGVAADRRQRLVEFVADARRHGAEGRELAGLDHFVLGAHQLALGLLAFVDFLLQLRVGVLQLAGAFQYALFQLALGLGLESDAVQVVTAAEGQQGKQQEQGEQGRAADQQDAAHRPFDEGAGGVDAHRPAGFR